MSTMDNQNLPEKSLEEQVQITPPKPQIGEEGVELQLTKKLLSDIFVDTLGSSVDRLGVLDRRNLLLAQFRENIFEDEYRVLYALIATFKKIQLTPEFVELNLRYNRKNFVNNLKIDLSKFVLSDSEDPVDAMSSIVINKIKNLISESETRPITDEVEWLNSVNTFKQSYRMRQLISAANMSITIAEDGTGEGRYLLQGVDDAITYLRTELNTMERVIGVDQSRGLISVKDYIEETAGKSERKFLMDFGLPFMDKVKGGIYSGTFTTILAPPKNLKSRFVYWLAHRAAVYFGQNVLVWPLEGGLTRGTGYLRALHYFHYWNYIKSEGSADHELDTDWIMDDNLSDEQRTRETESLADFLENVNYGKIHFIDEDCYLEDFISKLDFWVAKTNATILVIDYLTLIQSIKGMSRNDMLQTAYAQIVRWAVSRQVAVISPAQVKQIVINELSSGKVVTDPRTWAGETSAITRDSDNVIAMYSTDEQKEIGLIAFHDVSSRDSKTFGKWIARTIAGSCMFFNQDGWSYDSTGKPMQRRDL